MAKALELVKLEQFFSSPEFTTAIGEFLGKHARDLEFKPLEEEQPLRNFDIFKEYVQLVERQLDKFIVEQGLTAKSVYDACAAAQNGNNSAWMTCIDYLVACTEYEEFMQLAYDHHCMAAYDPNDATAWDPEPDGEGDHETKPLDA